MSFESCRVCRVALRDVLMDVMSTRTKSDHMDHSPGTTNAQFEPKFTRRKVLNGTGVGIATPLTVNVSIAVACHISAEQPTGTI